MSNKTVPPGAGTTTLTKTFITASQDKKSLPTQVPARLSGAGARRVEPFPRNGQTAACRGEPDGPGPRACRCMCGQATSTATACAPTLA